MRGAVMRKSFTSGARKRASTMENMGLDLDGLAKVCRGSRDLEAGRFHDVALDGALIGGAHDGVPVFLGEPFGEVDRQADRAGAGAAGILLGVEGEPQSRGVDPPLMAEAEGIETGAGAERGEEQLERL